MTISFLFKQIEIRGMNLFLISKNGHILKLKSKKVF